MFEEYHKNDEVIIESHCIVAHYVSYRFLCFRLDETDYKIIDIPN